jgi:Zn-dependent M16 (insulinase) family peptidase
MKAGNYFFYLSHVLTQELVGMGELIVNFLGPPPNAFLERMALDILGTYLTSSAVAPLNKEFIEIESPLWSVHIHGNLRCAIISDTWHHS